MAQLYAITLDAGQAHDAVQDAYARAWRRWVTVGRMPDPSAWVRSVAVRSTIRSWRSLLARIGIGAPAPDRRNIEPRTRAMLSALRRLPPAERRALVLTYMAGCSIEEIAAIEQVSYNTVQARLSRGRRLITENLADDLPALLGPSDPVRRARPRPEGCRAVSPPRRGHAVSEPFRRVADELRRLDDSWPPRSRCRHRTR